MSDMGCGPSQVARYLRYQGAEAARLVIEEIFEHIFARKPLRTPRSTRSSSHSDCLQAPLHLATRSVISSCCSPWLNC